MIELPAVPAPNGVETTLLDFGIVQRGAASIRVDRPGNRYRCAFSFPPMHPGTARSFVARLTRGKRVGVRVALPLLVPQGAPGSPVVDGAGQAGTTVSLRGLTPGYAAKEGYWITIVEGDGTAYLHQVAATVRADATGAATIEIEPALRAPFADGDAANIAAPYVEGFVDGEEWGWSVPVNRLVALQFTLEEYQ